jgi:hypothetical protein
MLPASGHLAFERTGKSSGALHKKITLWWNQNRRLVESVRTLPANPKANRFASCLRKPQVIAPTCSLANFPPFLA